MPEHICKRKIDTNECLNKYVWLIYSNIWMYLSHSVLNALRCYLRLKWYFSRICPALCLTDALSPTPFSFYEGPRAKADGPEAQYYHQLFFGRTIANADEVKITIFWICDWMLVCATSYNGSRLSDVLCSKYLGSVSCPLPDGSRESLHNTKQHFEISKQMLLVVTFLEIKAYEDIQVHWWFR